MKMDIEKFKKVIRSERLPLIFSSQAFIQEYRNLFEEDYIGNLSNVRGGFRKLHGPIGSYLRRKEKEIGIRKVNAIPDKNIKGNMTKCALWEKVNKGKL